MCVNYMGGPLQKPTREEEAAARKWEKMMLEFFEDLEVGREVRERRERAERAKRKAK